MLDPTGDSKRSTYSREDDSARRLWLTQRTKANPWEQRASSEEEDPPKNPLLREIAARAPEAAPTLIEQGDRLNLARPEVKEANPFAKLILNRLGLQEPTA